MIKSDEVKFLQCFVSSNRLCWEELSILTFPLQKCIPPCFLLPFEDFTRYRRFSMHLYCTVAVRVHRFRFLLIMNCFGLKPPAWFGGTLQPSDSPQQNFKLNQIFVFLKMSIGHFEHVLRIIGKTAVFHLKNRSIKGINAVFTLTARGRGNSPDTEQVLCLLWLWSLQAWNNQDGLTMSSVPSLKRL